MISICFVIFSSVRKTAKFSSIELPSSSRSFHGRSPSARSSSSRSFASASRSADSGTSTVVCESAHSAADARRADRT